MRCPGTVFVRNLTASGSALCGAVLLLGADPAVRPPSAQQRMALSDAAREALRPSCGRCHDGAQPTARPAALRVFDLAQSDWSAQLTEAEMDHMVGRFEGFKMPAADQVTVRRFLDAERTWRAGRSAPAPAAPPGD